MKRNINILKTLIISLSVTSLVACTSPNVDDESIQGTVTPADNVLGSDNSDTGNSDTNTSDASGASNVDSSSESASADEGADETSDSSAEDESTTSNASTTATTIYRDPISNNEPIKDGYLNVVFLGDEQFLTGESEGNTIPELLTNRFDYTNIYNLAIEGTTGAIPRSQTSTNLSDYEEPNFTAMAHVLTGDIKISALGDKVSDEVSSTCSKIDVSTVDYYVIGYGFYDYYNGIESINENNPKDEHSLYGAIITGIETLQEVSPNAQYIVCSPYYCRFYDENGADIGDAFSVTKGLQTLAVYADKTVLAAEQCYNTLKMPAISGTLFDLNGHTYTEYLESDGQTLNLKGRRIYTDALAKVIKYHLGLIGEEEFNTTITIADYT